MRCAVADTAVNDDTVDAADGVVGAVGVRYCVVGVAGAGSQDGV